MQETNFLSFAIKSRETLIMQVSKLKGEAMTSKTDVNISNVT